MNNKLKNMVLSAVFVALIATMSQVSVPLPMGVSLTLQTFAVALCGYSLPFGFSTVTVIVYILLGLIGIPVFANFGAGPTVLFGFSGGFIFGFIPFVFLCSLSQKLFTGGAFRIAFGVTGLFVCHICGVVGFSVLSGSGFFQSLAIVSLPFIIKDIISVVIAYFVSRKLITKILD